MTPSDLLSGEVIDAARKLCEQFSLPDAEQLAWTLREITLSEFDRSDAERSTPNATGESILAELRRKAYRALKNFKLGAEAVYLNDDALWHYIEPDLIASLLASGSRQEAERLIEAVMFISGVQLKPPGKAPTSLRLRGAMLILFHYWWSVKGEIPTRNFQIDADGKEKASEGADFVFAALHAAGRGVPLNVFRGQFQSVQKMLRKELESASTGG